MQCLPLLTLLVKKLWISPILIQMYYFSGKIMPKRTAHQIFLGNSFLCDCSLVDSSQRTSISASSYSIDNALFGGGDE
uniref:Ovule protein n=1 Tax=Ditylenchus dipsaci TaxID=166011 RepID=A0A915CTH7_9BILA